MIEKILEHFSEEEFLKADGFDDAIIGIEEGPMRLIYSTSKIIDILVKEGLTLEDALEHYYFNVQGGYVGKKTPVFCYDMI